MSVDKVRYKFEDNSIYSATDAELTELMKELATERVLNESMRHTIPVQAQAILYIQNARLIRDLEAARKTSERWFMILAIGSLGIGGVSVILQIIDLLHTLCAK